MYPLELELREVEIELEEGRMTRVSAINCCVFGEEEGCFGVFDVWRRKCCTPDELARDWQDWR